MTPIFMLVLFLFNFFLPSEGDTITKNILRSVFSGLFYFVMFYFLTRKKTVKTHQNER
ncbi:hypothetical protein [Chryseobacterium sp. Leaf180]|uniref:hypothetical protein n=1 Tax=Chryseobacterium sp. Leaf180 TaxID=1736289 RepID=UPI0012FF02F1|nr:hypothetical protein [Chryseobacterium sp. Leaf180]